MTTKTVSINFEVPESVDVTSEWLATAKGMFLDALSRSNSAGYFQSEWSNGNALQEEKDIADALLTES